MQEDDSIDESSISKSSVINEMMNRKNNRTLKEKIERKLV